MTEEREPGGCNPPDPADNANTDVPPIDGEEDATDELKPKIKELSKKFRDDGTIPVPKWCACLSLILLLAGCGIAVVLAVQANIRPRYWVPPELMDSMGMDGIIMFRRYDRDADGTLSMEEFEPLAHRLLELNETYDYDEPITKRDEVLTVHTNFKPLLLSSLSKNTNVKAKTLDPLRGLKRWKQPDVEWKNFAAADFLQLMPDKLLSTKVGHTYSLIGLPEGFEKGTYFSNNRYYPPFLVDPTEILIHRLLAMFHHRPFVISRFAPQGAFACIRAVSDKYIDVLLRVHAEFQLNEAPFHPFWFTPGKFIGRLIISRDFRHVRYFNLRVPTENKLNVDMEFLIKQHGENSVEVDIGFIPQMELEASHPSQPSVIDDADVRDIPLKRSPEGLKSIDNIPWNKKISIEEALQKIEVKFLPFKKIPYYKFNEVFDRAKAEEKLVHSVILWGALDDQSC